jgi:hypothetical protein
MPRRPPCRRWHPHQLDRPHFFLIWQRLLSSGRRTADPAEADFFYVPVSGRQLHNNDRAVRRCRCHCPHGPLPLPT